MAPGARLETVPAPDTAFVDLGGTSLSAVRAAAELGALSGRAVSAVQVLRAGSAAELARQVSVLPPAADPADPVGGRPRPPRDGWKAR
ncbi:acyl carrier protein [Streptacidiphilus sp. 4-A2]|nr:acyl carrier protein [Streptacidiphilus sp. 4-A2]